MQLENRAIFDYQTTGGNDVVSCQKLLVAIAVPL
jgi:hypothetical protein